MSNVIDDIFDFVGDILDPIVSAAEDIVNGVTDVVVQAAEWVVEDIISPVIDGVGDIVNYAIDNPIEAIAVIATTVAAGPTAALLGTTKAAVTAASTWAIPLASGAGTLAKGGNLEEAIKAATVAYAGAKIGGFTAKQVGTAVSQAGASDIVANIVGAGSKQAATALVYGQDPVEAFKNGGLTASVSATLGLVDEKIKEVTGGQSSWDKLDAEVKENVFATVAAQVGGADLSGAQLLSAVDSTGYISGIVDKVTNVSVFMDGLLKESGFEGLSAAQKSALTTAVTTSMTTAMSGNPELAGDAFFGKFKQDAYENLKKIIDKPVNLALDKFSGAYGETQAAAEALRTAEENAEKAATAYNATRDTINSKVAEQTRLKSAYDAALNKYNANKTEANANAVNAAASKLNSYVSAFRDEYNNILKPKLDQQKTTFDNFNNSIADLQKTYEDKFAFMMSDVDNLDSALKPLYTDADRAIALTLSPGFDEAAYRDAHNVPEDMDVYTHFLNNQKLPTTTEAINYSLDMARGNMVTSILESQGINIASLDPSQLQAMLNLATNNIKSFNDIINVDPQQYLDVATKATEPGGPTPGKDIPAYDKDEGVTNLDIATGNATLTNKDGNWIWSN